MPSLRLDTCTARPGFPANRFLIGGLVVLIGYVNQFASVFNDIASQYTQIIKYNTDVQNVADIERAWNEKHA